MSQWNFYCHYIRIVNHIYKKIMYTDTATKLHETIRSEWSKLSEDEKKEYDSNDTTNKSTRMILKFIYKNHYKTDEPMDIWIKKMCGLLSEYDDLNRVYDITRKRLVDGMMEGFKSI